MADQPVPSNSVTYSYIGTDTLNVTLSPPAPKSNSVNDSFNPIFNFDSKFGDNLLALQPTDIALAVPFVNFKVLDLGGQVIKDFNISFFQKQIDFSKINDGTRYSDRPNISLQDVELTTDQSSRIFILHKSKNKFKNTQER
jgi:hypothetical protein